MAADGSLGLEERSRADRQERREERREEWAEAADDYYAGYYDPYYGPGGETYYYALPCTPVVMATGGTVYHVCGSDWYTRAYVDDQVVYVPVAAP